MANFECLQVLSLNVRGLNEGKKCREIFRWLKRYHKGEQCIIFLQETHSTATSESQWIHDWGSKIYFSHGAGNARGVAILMPLKYNFEIEPLFNDNDGRVIALKLLDNGKILNLVNIYAPTKDKAVEQINFLNILEKKIDFSELPFLIGGDFNTYLDPLLDKEGGKIEAKSSFAANLKCMLDEHNITDIWRLLNPSVKRFTWRQPKPLIQSRLDYFFISGELFYNVYKTEIKPSIKTDHSLLSIEINLTDEVKRGPSFWKFNNALLRDEIYIEKLKNLINTQSQQQITVKDHGLKWDYIKSEIRQFTISYTKQKAKLRRQKEEQLKLEYSEAASKFADSKTQESLQHLESLKEQIEQINAYKTAGVHLRSKAEYIENNERSTAYFLNVEKRNYKMKHIQKLNISENETIHEPNQILHEEKLYFKKLYSKDPSINSTYIKDFAHNDIPKLTKSDKASCDKPITIEECSKALLTLKNGKSPGSDGLPPEFYKIFWPSIKHLVFASLKHGIEYGHLSIEQKRGILKLIVKKDKNPCYLKNWRPISLLNSDYKIFAQIFAIRLQKVLSNIVKEHQNGYIKGRFIGYNIRTIIDIINYTTSNKKDCLITFLDFEKAFDQLDWKFIEHTLTAFNFGSYFKNVVKTMYHGVTSCVMNNGYASEFFTIERGIRQGCPLSALLFILAAETLSINIIANSEIKGITVNDVEVKLTQLADDTTLFLKDVESLLNCLETLNRFHLCSGLKLNLSKTEILKIGNPENLNKVKVKLVTFARSLGITYYEDIERIIEENYSQKKQEIEKALNKWKLRNLTLLGKNTIIKTLIVPKLNHLISTVSTPDWFIESIQTLIFKFLWNNKPPKISNKVIINTADFGGLRFPDIETLVRSQKLAWIKRIVQNPQAVWLQHLYTYLP